MNDGNAKDITRATLREAAAAIARARQAFKSGGASDLSTILPAIDRCSAELLELSPELAEQMKPELLALLDDVQAAIHPLAAERQEIAAELRRANDQRAAGLAYDRSRRL